MKKVPLKNIFSNGHGFSHMYRDHMSGGNMFIFHIMNRISLRIVTNLDEDFDKKTIEFNI